MGAVDVWEVESCTEFEAARGRSPQTRIAARHRNVATAAGLLPAEGLHRFCDLGWFPRFVCGGEERRRFMLYLVKGLEGLSDGFYAPAAPAADVKVTFNRWFGGPA
jgi:hypothetical protein